MAELGLHPAAAPAAGVSAPAPEPRPAPVVVPGGAARPALPPAPAAGGADGVELEFSEAPLKTVVDTVLGDILKVPYLYDARVQGTVSVHTGRPLGGPEALGVVEALLHANGAALLRDGETWRVVPAEAARGGGLVASDSPGNGISALALRHVGAAMMQRLLAGAYPAEAVRAEPGLNLILAAGSSAERRAILEAARGFDVDWMAGRSVGIFPLAESRPAEVIRELQLLFGGGEAGTGAGSGPVRFLPVQRLNAVMVVAESAGGLDRAQAWIGRLDHGAGSGRRLYVHSLQHAKARELARLLGRLFGGGGTGPAGESALAPGATPVTMRLPAAAQTGEGQEAGALVTGPPPSPEPPVSPGGAASGGTADASAAESGGDGLAEGAGGAAGGVRIVADSQSNALVVLAFPDEDRLVEQALARLDVAPQQVLIEATIAEVTLNDRLRYGVQSFLKNNSGDVQGGFTLSDGGLRPVTQVPGFNLLLARSGDPRAVLSALDEVTDVTVVSSPQLVVMDNQTAQLQVGDRVPVITRQAIATDNPSAPVVNSVDYQDTGVILRVTPRINAGGKVAMDIQQEVSSVSRTSNTGTLTPTISRRSISSNVAVQSGQTVALGGLISDQQSRGHTGVPGLSRIPVLGALFSERSTGTQRTELLVFITPRVVRSADDAEAVTRELMSRISALQPAPAVPAPR
jgi:general secretion pathway protein D